MAPNTNDAVVAAQATAKLKQSAADAASAALAAAISAIEADLTAVTAAPPPSQ